MTACTRKIVAALLTWCIALVSLGSLAASGAPPVQYAGLSVGVSSLEEFRQALADPNVGTITLGYSVALETEQADWNLSSGPKLVLGLSGAQLTLPKRFDLPADTAMDELTLLGAGGGTNIFAGGHTFALGASIETPFVDGHFIGAIYGGNYAADTHGDTNLIIKGGQLLTVYGGGHNGNIYGSTNITLGASGVVQYISGGGSGYGDMVTGERQLIFDAYGASGDFRPIPAVNRFTSLGISGGSHLRLGASGLPDAEIDTINLYGDSVLWADGDISLPGVSLGASGGTLQLTSGTTLEVKSVTGSVLPVEIVGAPRPTYIQNGSLDVAQFLAPAGYRAVQDGPNRVLFDTAKTSVPVSLLAHFSQTGVITPMEVQLDSATWIVNRVESIEVDTTGTKRYYLKYTLVVNGGQQELLFAKLENNRLLWFIEVPEQI